MSNLITKRTPLDFGRIHYLDCADSRALGIDNCGCGKEVGFKNNRPFKVGLVEGIERRFYHRDSYCVVVVRKDTKGDGWIPLTCEEYLGLTQEAAQ